MNQKLKVAQVGVGGFGGYRRDRMRETGLFQLVAAYDLNPQALADAEAKDGARPCKNYEELLSVKGIEAVMISTGAKFHAEQALAAMRRGLHVFIEKPLCATGSEARALLRMQAKTGLVVGVGHNDHAHDAVSATIRSHLRSGKLGRIACFEKTTAHSGGLEIKPGDWRGDPKKNPGGMLFQCGVHALHELMFYFGPVRTVSCCMRYDVHTTRTADVAHCILGFESGVTGTLSAYHVTPYRHTFSIFGTRGALYRDDRFFDEGTKLVFQPRERNAKEVQAAVKIAGKSDSCGNLRSFYKAIRKGGTPYPSLIDGARAVAVVFCAEQAAKSGRAVNIAKMFPELQ